jgi:predicted negative regulator of RcsB-dependent stress response
MPFLPVAILTFLKDNIKWLVIGLLVIAISFGAWRYTTLVENYAKAQQTITLLEQNIKDKERALQFERDKAALTEHAIAELAKQNEQLEIDLKDITQNLAPDESDLTAESIREILRRLQGVSIK